MKCCGECKWWDAWPRWIAPACSIGTCTAPIPACVKNIMEFDTYADDGTTCPAFASQETPNET